MAAAAAAAASDRDEGWRVKRREGKARENMSVRQRECAGVRLACWCVRARGACTGECVRACVHCSGGPRAGVSR